MSFKWYNITEEKLRHLFCDEGLTDNQIAERYGVKYSQVRYKRNKFGIRLMDKTYEEFLENNKSVMDILNGNAKSRLLQDEKIDQISKAITRHIFRDGPVEDMHANGNLSQEDMKTLNKFMVNRIAGIIKLILENQWLKLELLVGYYRGMSEWDEAEPDTEIIERMYESFCSQD